MAFGLWPLEGGQKPGAEQNRRQVKRFLPHTRCRKRAASRAAGSWPQAAGLQGAGRHPAMQSKRAPRNALKLEGLLATAACQGCLHWPLRLQFLQLLSPLWLFSCSPSPCLPLPVPASVSCSSRRLRDELRVLSPGSLPRGRSLPFLCLPLPSLAFPCFPLPSLSFPSLPFPSLGLLLDLAREGQLLLHSHPTQENLVAVVALDARAVAIDHGLLRRDAAPLPRFRGREGLHRAGVRVARRRPSSKAKYADSML